MEIPGVPDSVPWSKIEAFLTDLGVDFDRMPQGCGGVTISPKDIRFTIYTVDEMGQRYADRSQPPDSDRRIAAHEVRVPITRDDTKD